jgi:hypothetical protein
MQIKLFFVIVDQSAVEGTPESIPVTSSAAKLDILPGGFLARLETLPVVVLAAGGHLLDVFIYFAATNIADVNLFTELENLLIEKTAVHANDYRHIGPILSSDLVDHVPDHVLNRLAMVGVLVSTAKNRIDDKAPPVHLQRLEALFPFIGRFYPFTALGVVVVQNHGVDAQLDHIGLADIQAPDKQSLQQATKQEYPRPEKGLEESFDLMRGGHLTGIGFDTARVTLVFNKYYSTLPSGLGLFLFRNRSL